MLIRKSAGLLRRSRAAKPIGDLADDCFSCIFFRLPFSEDCFGCATSAGQAITRIVFNVFQAGGESLEARIGGLPVRGRLMHLWGDGFEMDSHSCEIEVVVCADIGIRAVGGGRTRRA
jgi:hypothetical protein